MNKKLIALLAAALLALVGVLGVVGYARSADARAFAGAEMTTVLVVTSEIPAQSPAERLVGSVEKRRLPRTAVVDGALSDLAEVRGKQTNAALMPGEQLLAARFGGAAAKAEKDDALPEGMQQMDLQLAAPRIPSGVRAGDVVGVIASFAAKNGDGGYSNMTISKVRILAMEDVAAEKAQDQQGGAAVQLTLAVTTGQAQKIANAAEFGKIWLTAQGDKTNTNGAKRTSSQDVLR